MRNTRGRYIIFICAAVVLLALLAIKYLSYSSSPEYGFNTARLGMQSCITEKDAPQCARPYIAKMLETKNGAQIMDGLTDEVGRKYCHFIGHIVGQESYKKIGDTEASIAQCDRTCESACIHGVIGQTFADKLGYTEDPDDLAHLSVEQVREIGREICTANQTCHGVGHSIFQIYHKIDPSLQMCTEVAEGAKRAFCTVGVFMEYADVLSSRSAMPGSKIELPTPESLPALCTGFRIENDMRACMQYLPTITTAVYWDDPKTALARVEEICPMYTGYERSACFYGIGAFQNTYLLETRADKARMNCQKYKEFVDQAACNYGSFIIDVAIRQPAAFNYCKGMEDDGIREACYQNIFNSLYKREVPINEARDAYCANDAVCIRGAEEHLTNPYDYMVDVAKRQR